MTGLDTISTSSSITIGFVQVPSFSSLTSLRGGSLTLRQVAWRAKQARCGASDAVVETVEMEEMDDARDDLERSVIIDSGDEPYEFILMIEGRRDNARAS